MMIKTMMTCSFALLATTAACKKSSGGGGGGGGGDLPEEIAAWMPKDASAAWQGAWAGRMTFRTSGMISMAGDPAAIDVQGEKATAWDGTADHALGIDLAPCLATFAEKSESGGATMTTKHDKQYVIVGGKLVAGEGAAGYRKGKTAIVCSSGMKPIATLDDKGQCKEWSNFMGRWEGKPTTCAWSQDNGKDVLTIGTGDWSTKVSAEGDVLQSDQFRDYVKQGLHEKAADMTAAKAKVTAQIAAKAKG